MTVGSSNMIRVALVSKLSPNTHYTLFLGRALTKLDNSRLNLLFYRSRDEHTALELNGVKDVWTSGMLYPFQIFRQVTKDRPTIVHSQHEFNMFGGPLTALEFPLLLLLLKIARVKSIVTIHAIVPPSIIDEEFAKTYGVSQHFSLFLRVLLMSVYRSIVALSSVLIVHAKSHKSLLETIFAVKGKKVNVIPIGVPENPPDVPLSKKWTTIIGTSNVILFFGYLTARKGVEYLLSAFSQLLNSHPSWILVIAGGSLRYSGPYIDKLRSMIRQFGMSQKVIMVTTTPFPADEIHELFETAKIVVLPYTQPIGGGSLVLSYAIHHGKPVVVTDSSVMRELLKDGEEALFCKPQDSISLCNALKLMIENETLRNKMSDAICRKARSLAWSRIAEATKNVYVRLSAQNGNPISLEYEMD